MGIANWPTNCRTDLDSLLSRGCGYIRKVSQWNYVFLLFNLSARSTAVRTLQKIIVIYNDLRADFMTIIEITISTITLLLSRLPIPSPSSASCPPAYSPKETVLKEIYNGETIQQLLQCLQTCVFAPSPSQQQLAREDGENYYWTEVMIMS